MSYVCDPAARYRWTMGIGKGGHGGSTTGQWGPRVLVLRLFPCDNWEGGPDWVPGCFFLFIFSLINGLRSLLVGLIRGSAFPGGIGKVTRSFGPCDKGRATRGTFCVPLLILDGQGCKKRFNQPCPHDQ